MAFLNSDGGDLIIGIADDGEITGVDDELLKFFKNTDKYLLHIKNLIKTRIGEQFYPFIDYRIVEIDSKNVIRFACKPSQKPCYLDNKDFYVRTNPATDKLEGRKIGRIRRTTLYTLM